MQNKLRQLIMSALKRNVYTSALPLVVHLVGYNVYISGRVASNRQIQEVVSTIESVSPYLRVHVALQVDEEAPAVAR